MGRWRFFLKASRFQVIPVMIVPVLLGSIGAYAWHGVFHPILFVIALVGAGSAHLFSNMINDLWDYRNGTDIAAKETATAISTNSGFLAAGTIRESTFASITWALFAAAAVCGAALSLLSGWPVLPIALLGGLIAYFYVAPPIKFGYRGKGLSEIGILLSFGVLPVMGSYYVQMSSFDTRAFLVSLPVGLMTTLILFNHHFLHWQADQAAGKKTLVVVWGESRALSFSKFLMALAYASVIACVLFGALPVYSLIALITAVPLLQAYRKLGNSNPSIAYLPLMKASLQASMRIGMIIIAALWIKGIMS